MKTIISEDDLQSLVRKAENRERKAKRRAILYSLIPIILAVVLLWVSIVQIRHAERKVQEYKAEVGRLQERIGELNEALETTSRNLKEATDFDRYKFRHSIALAWKYIASRSPEDHKILEDILQMQHGNVRWKLGGLSPTEGFDSPSFAAYLLAKHNLLHGPIHSVRYRLREVLRSTNTPDSGDIVFYEAGYTMFYYTYHEYGSNQDVSFVIGMTPVGIVALDPTFAQMVAIRKLH